MNTIPINLRIHKNLQLTVFKWRLSSCICWVFFSSLFSIITYSFNLILLVQMNFQERTNIQPKTGETNATKDRSGDQEIMLICGLTFQVTTKLLQVTIRPLILPCWIKILFWVWHVRHRYVYVSIMIFFIQTMHLWYKLHVIYFGSINQMFLTFYTYDHIFVYVH